MNRSKRRSITFFSFFPAVALLATPLMFSTLAPASTGDFVVDSSEWIVPQSFMTTDEILEAQNIRNKEIGEVKFLQYDEEYIYRASDNDYGATGADTAHEGEASFNEGEAFRNEPAITDQGEIDTAYVLQNPEFQRQVEEVSAQATQAGATMPPLLTLIALFAFAVATGTSSLKDFVKFSTYTEKVKKTIQVTKKVAKTVYKTITETVARKVKTVKTIAYTAYETVKNVSYNTRTWVTEAVKHKPVTWHPIEQMEMKAKFLLDNINKYQGKFTRSYAKNVRYYTPNLSEYAYLKKEYDDVASGRKVGRYAQNVQHSVWNERQTLDSQAGQFFDGIADPKLREKLLAEYKSLNDVTYTEKTTHSETTPVVTYVEKPYTAYREEVETKTVYDTISREVPETIYEDVIENHEMVEDVTKYAFTPLNDKIDLAMGYLKNYSRIIQSPSNRNFLDSALSPNRDTLLLAGAYEAYNQLTTELQTASIYNVDRTDPKEVEKLLKRHNEFVYSMKTKLAQIEKGKTPEEQMGILFGREYTDSIRESENAIASASAEEKALTARFNEIEELLRTNKISTGYYRSLYGSAKRNRDQLYRRHRDAEKNLKKSKEYYTHKFNGTITSLQNLSFLRSLEDWRRTLDYGERTISSRLVQFTTANGSTVYRRANAQTPTQAQPKKTIPKQTPANLTASASPANLQTSGFRNWLKNRKQQKIEAKKAEQKREFLEYDRAKTEAEEAEIKAKEIAKEKAESKMRILDAKNKQVNIILNKVVDNFPLENPSQRYLNLGSGYHDGASYYAVDLNSVSGGDHDRGDSVFSVSKGTIIIGSEVISNGALRIQHTGNTDGKDFTWQSNYLHLPIFDTGKSETVDVLVSGVMKKEERKIYEVRKQVTTYDEKGKSVEIITTDKSDEMIKIWADKVVQSGEQIGYVGGRMADNDTIDNAHLHFSATLDSMAVDLRTTLESAGLKTFKAFDGYGTSRFVNWNEALQVWVNDSDKLILDRRAQETLIKGPTPYQSWRAWEGGKSVKEMEVVVWVETEILPDGTKAKVNAWLQADDYSQLWDSVQRKFVPRK